MNDLTYKQAIQHSEALKAIGQTEVYLSYDDPNPPWDLATKCEGGSSFRLGMETSVRFSGRHEPTGLMFKWSFDIEPHSSNGKGHYEINVNGCREVLKKLPKAGKDSFVKWLRECAKKVKEKGSEWQAIADRQFNDAAILNQLAEEVA